MSNPIRSLVEKSLSKLGVCHLKADGISMLPVIKPGDLLEIIGVNQGELFPGQIILFEQWNQMFVHRIKYRTSMGFVTAGDANILMDEPVLPEQIIGLVIAVINSNGVRTPLYQSNEENVEPEGWSNPLNISFFLPSPYYSTVKEVYCGINNILHFDQYTTQLIGNTYAVSHVGLTTEDEFIEQIIGLKKVNILCFVNLGPENEKGLFPVNYVRSVFRPNYYNHVPNFSSLAENSYPLSLMGYLYGLLNSISILSKKRERNVNKSHQD